jgi:hypothetical protein
MASDKQVEDAVVAYLATTDGHWRKVAMVFAMVTEALGEEFPNEETCSELFNRCIETLINDGRLTSQGDVKLWRHSEVRLT